MKVYVVSTLDNIVIFSSWAKAENYIINHIFTVYKTDKDNVYIDKYDTFASYTFKYYKEFLTFRITEKEVQ